MTLLAPGAMLLAAVLTVPPLVMFYLLKLRRRPLRVTSTMLWEQAAHDLQVNVPLKWITPNWLLLLHALILALLLTAIGRPAIEHGGSSADRVFVLIDRSASMSARDMPDGATRLASAKTLAKETIASMSRGAEPPEITLIAYAAEPIVLVPPTRDLRRLNGVIDAVEPTDQPGRLDEALGLVRSLTTGADEDEDVPPPLTVLVTDGAELRDRRSPIDAATRFVPVTPASTTPPNAGVVSFATDRDVETPETVRVFVRLLNAGPDPVAAPLVVSIDEEPVVRRAVSIPGSTAGGDPGESVESIRFDNTAGGVLEVSLEHADALEADNTVRAVLPPHRRPPTLLVVPPAQTTGDPADARDRADPFLLDVLEALDTAGLRVIDLDRYRRGDDETLASFGLIVFDRVAPDDPPTRPTLSFGAPWPGLPDRGEISASETGRTPVLAWDRGHPVMRDAVLDSVIIADRIALPEDDLETGDPVGPRRRRHTLARGEGGPLILEIDDAGTPRIVVGFALEQSNWPVHFSFPIFMLAAFDHLAPDAASGIWHDAASPTTVRLDRPVRSLRLDGPTARTISPPEGDVSTTVPLGIFRRTGLYTLSASGGGGGSPRPIAVNLLDAGESSLAWITPENTPDATASSAGGPGEQREIWRWFILAAGGLLFLEWLVYARRARF